jgi:DedD protein
MPSSQDTEITLGTGKLLVLFFMLVAICASFFALGYSLGRKSQPAVLTADAASPQVAPGTAKPAGSESRTAAPMSFYKAVEQKDASPDLSPADAKSDAGPAAAPSNPSDSSATLPTAGYYVQVAAVSKQEDADALVEALKKKQYAAFVAAASATDKLFHVQVGPFTDIKEAEAVRARLIGDGYNPILKK